MPGVLGALAEMWQADPVLTEIVPADHVILGPPVPGHAVPAIAWTEATVRKETVTAGRSVLVVRASYEAEVETEEEAHTLADAVPRRLVQWSTDELASLALTSWQVSWARDPHSASEQWIVTGHLEYYAETRTGG